MKKVIRLTEADLTRLVRRVIKEQGTPQDKFNASIAQKSQDNVQSIKNRVSTNPAPPSIEDVKVFNQIKKELSSVVKPTMNTADRLQFTGKLPEGNEYKHIPMPPGTDFFFEFFPVGEMRDKFSRVRQNPTKYQLGNTEANMSAENPEIDKLIRQLPGYNSEGYAEFFINTENMGDLLPKIKNILQKASVVGVQDFSSMYPTRDRSVVPQGRQGRIGR